MRKMKLKIAIFLSIVMAWMFMMIPMPAHWQWVRPEWITLVLIYWVFSRPQLVGVGVAFCAGLGMDVLGGVLIGQYALAMTLIVYFTHQLRNRVRAFPLWQQAFVILMLVGLGQLSLLVVQWLIGLPPTTLWYWMSPITSIIVWRFVYRVLRYYEQKMV